MTESERFSDRSWSVSGAFLRPGDLRAKRRRRERTVDVPGLPIVHVRVAESAGGILLLRCRFRIRAPVPHGKLGS